MEIFKEPEVVAAIIAVIGVIITALVSIITVSKEIYAKNVIEQRTKWLTTFREKLGIFVAAWVAKSSEFNKSKTKNGNENLTNNDIDKSYEDLMFKGEEARFYMISMLNTSTVLGNEYNFYLKKWLFEMKLIGEIDNSHKEMFEDAFIEKFMECANLMLESVWQKAKQEAKK